MLSAECNLNNKRIMIKVTHKNRIKIEVAIKINKIIRVLHKHRNMKK